MTLARDDLDKLVIVTKRQRRRDTTAPLGPISVAGAPTADEQSCEAKVPAEAPTEEQARELLRECATTLDALAKTQKQDEAAS